MKKLRKVLTFFYAVMSLTYCKYLSIWLRGLDGLESRKTGVGNLVTLSVKKMWPLKMLHKTTQTLFFFVIVKLSKRTCKKQTNCSYCLVLNNEGIYFFKLKFQLLMLLVCNFLLKHKREGTKLASLVLHILYIVQPMSTFDLQYMLGGDLTARPEIQR